jgi:hypothetical protein
LTGSATWRDRPYDLSWCGHPSSQAYQPCADVHPRAALHKNTGRADRPLAHNRLVTMRSRG